MTAVSFDKPLPQYKCHKVVGALRIRQITIRPALQVMNYILEFDNPDYDPVIMSEAWFNKHAPKTGGYLVQYNDGYFSYSPAEAFEDGYTAL